MAKTDLTAQRLRELLHYDPATGVFTWLFRPNRRFRVGDVAGGKIEGGYIRTMLDGQMYRCHRLAWLYVHGTWPVADIDHIDGNPANNAISNLRDVSRTVNTQNKRTAQSNNKSCGVLGVSKHSGRWRARIRFDGLEHVTYHATIEEAQAAYLAAKRAHHPGNML